jgi:ABC-type Fe3+-hydroxamate transport system substrate-binding protein
MGRHRVILTALWLLLTLAGCSGDVATEIDTEPQRIVVLAPAAAEMLESLELLDRVVGRGDFGPWPEPLSGLPAVGGYDSPNVERLLELECDMLLTVASDAGLSARRRLEAVGVRVVALETGTYEGIFESLDEIGRLFDRQAQARAIQIELKAQLSSLAALAEGASRRRVLFVVGRDPLYVAGPGSHIDEMIRMVGGVNVAADAISEYQQLSIEAVLERMPEIIIDASDNRPDALRGRQVGSWGRWEFLPAVRHRRVYHVEPGRLVIPGLRLPEMTRLMGQFIHPEIYGDPDEATP